MTTILEGPGKVNLSITAGLPLSEGVSFNAQPNVISSAEPTSSKVALPNLG